MEKFFFHCFAKVKIFISYPDNFFYQSEDLIFELEKNLLSFLTFIFNNLKNWLSVYYLSSFFGIHENHAEKIIWKMYPKTLFNSTTFWTIFYIKKKKKHFSVNVFKNFQLCKWETLNFFRLINKLCSKKLVLSWFGIKKLFQPFSLLHSLRFNEKTIAFIRALWKFRFIESIFSRRKRSKKFWYKCKSRRKKEKLERWEIEHTYIQKKGCHKRVIRRGNNSFWLKFFPLAVYTRLLTFTKNDWYRRF